ncbi:hypothetical protein Ddc_13453 [Ditylenchus destructor]|nr:hypothetical protein Ddc_13453 [Ditylenchus destructor]
MNRMLVNLFLIAMVIAVVCGVGNVAQSCRTTCNSDCTVYSSTRCQMCMERCFASYGYVTSKNEPLQTTTPTISFETPLFQTNS